MRTHYKHTQTCTSADTNMHIRTHTEGSLGFSPRLCLSLAQSETPICGFLREAVTHPGTHPACGRDSRRWCFPAPGHGILASPHMSVLPHPTQVGSGTLDSPRCLPPAVTLNRPAAGTTLSPGARAEPGAAPPSSWWHSRPQHAPHVELVP